MKKLLIKILFLNLLFIPTIVFASNGSNGVYVGPAIAMEAFITLHMCAFVLKPLSEMFAKENSKKLFWCLFAIRAVILLFFDFFITPNIAIFDFFGLFICGFIVVPICATITKTPINKKSNQVVSNGTNLSATQTQTEVKGIELRCAKCNSVMQLIDKFCGNCGTAFDGNNVVVSEKENAVVNVPNKEVVLQTSFDAIYRLPEDKMLEEFINKELLKCEIDVSSKLIPSDILKRKKILNIIFCFLVFVFITLIFFHFPIYTYLIGMIILFIFYKVTRNYNLIKYLKKEVKARPSEKISNIVMNVKNTFTIDNTKKIFIPSLLVAIVLPLIIFAKPKILYEKVDDGYAVRYYIFGLNNFKTVIIPKTYRNEQVVSLRGNTFSNMPFLKSVKLPDSITEIRGQAFKNCINLTEVNIPKKLEYLGGGAFYNAKSIKKIELPDTLTYLGGESFYNAKSLEYIKLSNNITEIRGNSFENCTSLKQISIPDNVTRIGGHAFYGNSSLSEVEISKNSKLTEIGSSAFRQCSNLYNITIPSNTDVNERTFKESPTTVNRYNENISQNNNSETDDYEDNSKSNEINNNDEKNNNYIISNSDESFETQYILFNKEYKKNIISLNNGQNNLEYFTGFLSNRESVYVSGHVTNYKYLLGNFDMITEYYDENYKKIGTCSDQIDLLGKGYSYISFSCHTKESEIKGSFDSIKYYKIYIENFNIKD